MAAALSGCYWDVTGFFDLRVVNDTSRAVKIRPCWDKFCLDTAGMPYSVLRPGDSHDESNFWANDSGDQVTVEVFSLRGKRIACLTTGYAARQATGVVRVSQMTKCRAAPLSGGGGGG